MINPLSSPDGVPPVQPVARTGDALRQPKPEPEQPKKRRATVLPDGTVELQPEQGEAVIVSLQDFAQRYRELFGEDPPAGTLLNVQA